MHFFPANRCNTRVIMPAILLLGGTLPLLGALVSQYAFGLHPCHFCLLQRYPYLVVIAAGLLALWVAPHALGRRVLVALAIYALLVTAMLGLVHTGIESKFLAYSGGCVAQAPANGSLDALRAAIAGAPLVACDQATAVFLGISMAGWNVLWAGFVLLLTACQYRKETP